MQSSMVMFNFSVLWVGVFLPLCWFSLNNSEKIKAVNLVFCSINFLLETFMPNLVSLTCPSLQILDRTQTKVFPIFEFLVKSLNKNGHNSETSNHIDKKLAKKLHLTREIWQRKKNWQWRCVSKLWRHHIFSN